MLHVLVALQYEKASSDNILVKCNFCKAMSNDYIWFSFRKD